MILLLHAACNNVLINSEQHLHHINDYNNAICNALSITSMIFIAVSKFRCSQDFIDPGFNEHVKELHNKTSECYLI